MTWGQWSTIIFSLITRRLHGLTFSLFLFLYHARQVNKVKEQLWVPDKILTNSEKRPYFSEFIYLLGQWSTNIFSLIIQRLTTWTDGLTFSLFLSCASVNKIKEHLCVLNPDKILTKTNSENVLILVSLFIYFFKFI